MAKEVEKRVKVLMLREVLGERNADGVLPKLEVGQVYEVGEKFASRLAWKRRAKFATKEDEAAAKKSGPITNDEVFGKKGK